MRALWCWQEMRLHRSWQAWWEPRQHVPAGLGARASVLPWATLPVTSAYGAYQNPCSKVHTHTLAGQAVPCAAEIVLLAL